MHEKICESLREHALEVISFKKEKMKLITKELQKSYQNAKNCYICKEKLRDKYAKDKNMVKLGIIVIIQGNIEVLRIAYVIRNIAL